MNKSHESRTMGGVIERANTCLVKHQAQLFPHWILQGCKGVGILTLEKVAGVLGVSNGDGVIIKHNEDGSWGAPAAITVDSISVGASIGRVDKYVLLYPMSEKGLKNLTADGSHLGAGIGMTLGPGAKAGREMEAGGGFSKKGADAVYSYIVSEGVMLDVGLNTGKITQENKLNEDFYGSEVSAEDIVMKEGAVTIPKGPKGKGVEQLHEELKKLVTLR